MLLNFLNALVNFYVNFFRLWTGGVAQVVESLPSMREVPFPISQKIYIVK
jgi:hypothetical protein